MSVIDESFINGSVSAFSSELVDLSLIRGASSFESLLKILSHSSYASLSSRLVSGDVVGAEQLFFNYLFSVINYFKRFASIRIKRLLALLFDYWFGYFCSVSNSKGADCPFSFSPLILGDDLRYSFLEFLGSELLSLKGLFSGVDFSLICSFINYRLNGYSFRPEGLSVVSDLLFFLFNKEVEVNSILRVIRSLAW